jgi:hypothetical protein
MDRTIFIPDENDKNLPAYTEWGYNSFGACYGRNYFLVSNCIEPCKIVYADGVLRFSLHGIYTGSSYDYYHDNKMSVSFGFPMESVSDYVNLVQLNNITKDIYAEDCTVKITMDGREETVEVLDGSILYFKRVQLLNIDEQPNRAILSGIFDLRFIRNGYPENISDGRFDVGINNETFYAY